MPEPSAFVPPKEHARFLPMVLIIAGVVLAAAVIFGLVTSPPISTKNMNTVKNVPTNTSTTSNTINIPQYILAHHDAHTANPPFGVNKCDYQGKTYYLVGGGAPDSMATLTNPDGTVRCSPSGGFTGRGSSTCQAIDGAIVKTCAAYWNSRDGYK